MRSPNEDSAHRLVAVGHKRSSRRLQSRPGPREDHSQTIHLAVGLLRATKPSEGVLHDLWAKALVLEDAAGGRVAIVSTDLIGLPREVSDAVAARLEKQFGLKRSQLLLNSSHTHSGPVVWPGLPLLVELDADNEKRAREYSAELTDTIVRVVAEAVADLAPAQVLVGHGSATFAANRRQPASSGVRIGVNAKGPIDHDVPVVKIASPDGKLRAVLFGYACHNTTLGGNLYRINGDYAGFAQIELEKALPGASAMFVILCGADQNPNPRGTVEIAAQYGAALATEVRRVLGEPLRTVQGPIRTAFEITRLPLAPHDRATFEAELKQSNVYRQRRARLMLAAYDRGQPIRDVAYPVQAVRCGNDLTLVALGGEVVVDYALRLKREFPRENLVVAGYSNDLMCYIPSDRVLKEGGYEPVDSMIYYGQPGPFAPGVEELVIAACRRVLEACK